MLLTVDMPSSEDSTGSSSKFSDLPPLISYTCPPYLKTDKLTSHKILFLFDSQRTRFLKNFY